MPTAIAEQLPQRKPRVALAGDINPDRQANGARHPAWVSEEELERLLSGGRAVGRARVVYTRPADDVLEAVLAGLRAL
ncbi:hypothetical protein QTQ03_20470 [Micromonospora sp. WMMA1363]|uniref:hypothetical protein n=1 Tax=Micromonospora sp. WMMA1363 TaxID=3053985 RepID=UPI00259CD86E|nr:hypothetical protein [Micromonospora sp. WMMA1363]MDM4718445.1 hypothetical protein [Micromonospora sp. WMMA1363]MDM4721854.1 hypothetical protein [Micromonospora sp. WMMA1363]